MSNRLCKKCLLAEIDVDGVYASIAELLKLMPPEKKASDDIYENRLELCRKCDFLNEGTCGKCGCFVELRAAKKDMHCPHENHFW